MKKSQERPLVSPLPDKTEKERTEIHFSELYHIQMDITKVEASMLLATPGGSEEAYLQRTLEALYKLKESYGK